MRGGVKQREKVTALWTWLKTRSLKSINMMKQKGFSERRGLGDGGGKRDGKPWGRKGTLGKGWGDQHPKEAHIRCARAGEDCDKRPSGFVERLQAPLHRCANELNGIGWRKEMESEEKGFDDVKIKNENGRFEVIAIKGKKSNVDFVKAKEKLIKSVEEPKVQKNPGELLSERYDKMNKNNINMKVVQKIYKVNNVKLAKEMKITKGERHPDQKSYKKATLNYPDQKKVLICGTSLTDQALIKDVFTKQTGMVLNFTKLYTIEGDGKFKPEDNVEDKLISVVKKTEPDLVVIECGVNDISNSNHKNKKESENKMENEAEKLGKVAEEILTTMPDIKIIILETLPRIDNLEKKNLGEVFNKKLSQISEKKLKNMYIRKLDIDVKGKMNQVDIFGECWEKSEKLPCDGLHFRGKKGKAIYTSKLINTVKSLVVI